MRLMQLLKKIFVPSYTDKQVDRISAKNQKVMHRVSSELRGHSKTLADVGFVIYIASGGKHGH